MQRRSAVRRALGGKTKLRAGGEEHRSYCHCGSKPAGISVAAF